MPGIALGIIIRNFFENTLKLIDLLLLPLNKHAHICIQFMRFMDTLKLINGGPWTQ